MYEQLTYAELIKQLDEVVKKLEQDDLSLEDAIKYYKEGIDLAKVCKERLDNAKQEVIKVASDNQEEPFNIEK